jgi:hypothetical protein
MSLPFSWSRNMPFLSISWCGVKPSPLLLRPLIGPLYQPCTIMDADECGATDGMLGRGNQSTRKKLSPVPLCPPQILDDLTRARIQATMIRSQWLTTWDMAQAKKNMPYSEQQSNINCKTRQWGQLTHILIYSSTKQKNNKLHGP